MTHENSDVDLPALSRMVDMKIPLWSVLSFIMFLGAGAISMYYKLEKVSETLGDLQVTVRSGNSQSSVVLGELALLKYRVENLEQHLPPRTPR